MIIPRPLLLIPLALLPACQTPSTSQTATPAPSFNQSTTQTYDLQTGEFQQAPPFGARSDRSE